ncbi:glycosyltransferase family 4 protein [Polynucleobacter sp. P1-05-14]|uniref:glycosyltransferase family 4 protein n=1 Tax=Polynucleobacter sp. P1-05-14 TaxID=1819732 RepID=UPI001C0C51FF|nr:glycosyltransferase family 4 protein [Polynucleobacter sp. P1-05-14]MBU3548023.1 glycosyltransferase family 4 protein [Polynucleobacter sp. P1-05-14]
MNNKKYRVAILNTHPIQYFAPMYSYFNKGKNIDVHVFYCSDISLRGGFDNGFKKEITWDIDLLRGYNSSFLGKNYNKRDLNGFFSLVCPQIWREIRRGKFDALWLHGFTSYLAFLIAFLAAKSCKIPVYIRSDNHLGLDRSKIRRLFRSFIFKLLYKYVDGFLSIGELNRKFYLDFGVPEEKIFFVPYAVDNERFISSSQISEASKISLRREYAISSNKPVILYASKLTQRKHPDKLIVSLATLKEKGIEASLLIVGSGEMESDIINLAKKVGLTDVSFAGFINQNDLPKFYSVSDIFVLPAENEPWGLIVNEVMCAGLPIIISNEVGCVPDLVKNGVNGLHINPCDINSLTNALEILILDFGLRKRMGAASLEIIKNWNFSECEKGLIKALDYNIKSNCEYKN